MMLNTFGICWLKWLSDKFLTISLNMPTIPYDHLATVSRNPHQLFTDKAGWVICPKCQELNPWLFADETWTIYQEYWQILGQFCREIPGSVSTVFGGLRGLEGSSSEPMLLAINTNMVSSCLSVRRSLKQEAIVLSIWDAITRIVVNARQNSFFTDGCFGRWRLSWTVVVIIRWSLWTKFEDE